MIGGTAASFVPWDAIAEPEVRRVAESLPDGPLSYQAFVRRHIGEEDASAGPGRE